VDWSKVSYIFFALMSLTTTAGFIYEPNLIAISIAVGVNLISTLLKIGSKNQHSMGVLASSFVADLHLIPVLIVLIYSDNTYLAISFAIGAIIANLYSIVLVLIESAKSTEEEY